MCSPCRRKNLTEYQTNRRRKCGSQKCTKMDFKKANRQAAIKQGSLLLFVLNYLKNAVMR